MTTMCTLDERKREQGVTTAHDLYLLITPYPRNAASRLYAKYQPGDGTKVMLVNRLPPLAYEHGSQS